jgi:hypothetical protein
MWQPRQTLENNCSPLFSVNPKPVLNTGLDAESPAFWAWAVHNTSKDATDIVTMKLVFRRLKFPCMIGAMPPFFDKFALRLDYTVMQPGDRVKRR